MKKYVVLLSNGMFEHNWHIFNTREEAEEYHDRVKYKWNNSAIVEVPDSVQF